MNIPLFIDTEQDLITLCDFLNKHECIAVDTEFVWQRTYFPKLGIIQLGVSREEAFIIDTVAIENPAPLREVMENENIVKIFHDAHQDITIINRYIEGTVTNVFDTQLAAGFTNRPRSLSLEKLIAEMTGIHLAKSETRTNWLKRPLDPEQIEYAIDDVRYLPEIHKTLLEDAGKFNNESFVEREMKIYNDIIPFDFDEALARQFRRVCGRIPTRFRSRAFRLVRFQEEQARLKDVPREHVIKKEVIADLAMSEVSSYEELMESPVVQDKLKKKYGQELADALSGTDNPTKEMLKSLRRPAADSNEMVVLIALYQSFIYSIAHERGIDPTLLFNKSDISGIIRSFCKKRTGPHVQGWRGELINRISEKFLTGKTHINCEPLPEEDEN